MTSVTDYLAQHATEILEDLKCLVRAESPSADKAAVDACGRVLSDIVQARLGVATHIVDNPKFADHRCFSVGNGAQRTAILGHFDTVWDIGRLTLRETDGKLYGPGVLDMKGGIIQAIWAVKALVETQQLGDRQIRFILTGDEELSSPSSREFIETEAAQCTQVLVVEPAVDHSWTLKTERKGIGRYDIQIKGRAAHAGNSPEKGVNAVQEMARQIIAIHALNAPELGTTLNVGIAAGGKRANVVADRAQLGIDLRVTSTAEAERLDTTLKGLTPYLDGAELEITGGLVRPPMEHTPKSRALFAKAQAAALALGYAVQQTSVGGGSDGNFTAAIGIPTLDGLGATGAGPHAEHEHVIIEDLPKRAALLAELIKRL